VVRGRRYPLAICRVRVQQPMEHVVRTLLARVVPLGIRMKLLLLDRGFYSVRGIQDRITAELPFIMPAVKRGTKPTTPGGPTGTYAPAAAKQSHWTTYRGRFGMESSYRQAHQAPRRCAWMQWHVSVYHLTAHQPWAGTGRDRRRGRLVGRRPTTRPAQA
jgi:hypothetical protein